MVGASLSLQFEPVGITWRSVMPDETGRSMEVEDVKQPAPVILPHQATLAPYHGIQHHVKESYQAQIIRIGLCVCQWPHQEDRQRRQKIANDETVPV